MGSATHVLLAKSTLRKAVNVMMGIKELMVFVELNVLATMYK